MIEILNLVPMDKNKEIPSFIQHQLTSFKSNLYKFSIYKFSSNQSKNILKLENLLLIKDLIKYLKSSKAKIIHIHWGSFLGFIGTQFNFKKKTILTLRGSDLNFSNEDSLVKNYLRKYFTLAAVRNADEIICVSKELAQKIFNYNKKITIIPDGTPIEIFSPIDKDVAKNKLKWNPQNYYILFHCGNRPKHKNFDLALEVFQLVKETLANTEFIFFHNELSQADLALYFSGADLLLFTSSAEGSPNIVREAIACGCPVVALNVGDVQNWIDISGAGGVVAHSKELLAEKSIETILNSKRANSEISALYSTQNSAKLISSLYSKLGQKYGLE